MLKDLANTFWKFEGKIFRFVRNSEGGLTSERWDGKGWEKGGNLIEITFEGREISPDEAAELTKPS